MNTKLGFYKVNGHIFFNKLQAILYANLSQAEVTWHFNNDVLDKVDWSNEPPISLDMLYKARAEQIRENFDYVILMCSGGADSTNMLRSFLNNNLRVDEVIAGAPMSGLNNWKVDLADQSAGQTITETMVAQLPLMKELSQTHPNIKITIHDYFEDILKLKTDEWIYEAASHWIHFSGATRHSLDKYHRLRDMAAAGKKIAVVYGIDKPVICRAESGNLYTVIADPVVNVVTPHFKEKFPNVESILFYYTPDLPELLVKQAHDVCRWIYRPENSRAKAVLWDKSKSDVFNGNVERASHWQRNIVPCIYPAIVDRFGVWQALKQTPGFLGGFQLDQWILDLHHDHKFVDMVKSDLNLFVKQISNKYLVGEGDNRGFMRFYHYWKIGHESKFLPTPIDAVNTTQRSIEVI